MTRMIVCSFGDEKTGNPVTQVPGQIGYTNGNWLDLGLGYQPPEENEADHEGNGDQVLHAFGHRNEVEEGVHGLSSFLFSFYNITIVP
jgi:hypothetical protein